MVAMRVIVDGKGQVFLRQLGPVLKRATPRALALASGRIKRRIGIEIVRFAENPTGKLAASFTVELRKRRRRVESVIGSPLVYAGIHERGGVIRSRSAKNPLRFFWKGRWFSKHRVFIRPKRYVSKAVEASLGDLEKTFRTMAFAAIRTARRRARA